MVDFRQGWTFSDLRPEPDGVTATVVDPVTKVRRAVQARYLVACDGARRTVRRCLAIAMDEWGEPPHCSVYFTSRDARRRGYGRAFVTMGAEGVTLVSRDERHAWTASVPLRRGEQLTRDPMELVRERLGLSFTVDEVLSVAQWDGALGVADAYAQGPTVLAGDAAHQFYPAGARRQHRHRRCRQSRLEDRRLGGVGRAGPARQLRRRAAAGNPVQPGTLRQPGRGLAPVRPDGAEGAPAQLLAGLLAQDAYQVDNIGVHFGHRYSASPIVWPESGDPPPWHWNALTPTTWPGARVPAVRLADGSQLFDRLGPWLTLVDLSGHGLAEPLVRKAQGRGIPMTHLPVADQAARACWERALVLVRPDDHVAWRGDETPDDWDAVLTA
jgi:hypothetical protein